MKKLTPLVAIMLFAGAGCSTSSSTGSSITTDAFTFTVPADIEKTELDFAGGYRLQNYDDSIDPNLYPDNAFYVDLETNNYTMDDFTAVYPNVAESYLGVGDEPMTLAYEYASGDEVFTLEDAYFHEPTGTLITIHYFTTIGLQAAETLLEGITWK